MDESLFRQHQEAQGIKVNKIKAKLSYNIKHKLSVADHFVLILQENNSHLLYNTKNKSKEDKRKRSGVGFKTKNMRLYFTSPRYLLGNNTCFAKSFRQHGQTTSEKQEFTRMKCFSRLGACGRLGNIDTRRNQTSTRVCPLHYQRLLLPGDAISAVVARRHRGR